VPVVIVPLVIVLDQIFKLWAQRTLDPIPDPFLPGLYLTYVKNTGAAFGLFFGQTTPLGWISLVVGVFILAYLATTSKSRLSTLALVALSLLAAGALGNAIDRIGRGYVIDYLDIGPGLWPVFNLADAAVVIGALLLIISGGRRK